MAENHILQNCLRYSEKMRYFSVYLSALRGDSAPLVEVIRFSSVKNTKLLTHLPALFNVAIRKCKDILEGLHC